ncbi:hypothetical protein Angca_001986, partial [Angiostrongylus cantonensis]
SFDCDLVRRTGVFSQIQLFNSSLLIVEHLSIIMKQYLNREDFICNDYNGWIRRPSSSASGTSQFCKTDPCSSTAKHWYIRQPGRLYHQSHRRYFSRRIPLKGWDTIIKPYYVY